MPDVTWTKTIEGYSNTYGCEIKQGKTVSLDDERADRAIKAELARKPTRSKVKAEAKTEKG